MIQTSDLHWLAGLMEGEGCFTLQKGRDTPRIHLNMTDQDVVMRAASIFGRCASVRFQPRQRAHHKDQWQLQVADSVHAPAWMMTLYPLMAERRRARILEVLEPWRAKVRKKGPYRVMRYGCKVDECESPHRSMGFCNSHYHKDYELRKKEKIAHMLDDETFLLPLAEDVNPSEESE